MPSGSEERSIAVNQWVIDCRSAFSELEKFSHSDDSTVKFALGRGYCSGVGTTKDSEKGEVFLLAAAEAGHPEAMVEIGQRSARREEIQEKEKSVHWYLRAADVGSTSGMIFLGFAYREGKGVARDYEKAAEWFKLAAAAGDKHACHYVGNIYSVYLNEPAKAERWFLLAADAGYADSMLHLGFLYENRESPLYDLGAAEKWFSRVLECKGGSKPRAMHQLALLAYDGMHGYPDRDAALDWLNKAEAACLYPCSIQKEIVELRTKIESRFL